jgi:hypothetical protein
LFVFLKKTGEKCVCPVKKRNRSGLSPSSNSNPITACNDDVISCYNSKSEPLNSCAAAYDACRSVIADSRFNLIYSNATLATNFLPFPDPYGNITPLAYNIMNGQNLILPSLAPSLGYPNLTSNGMLPMAISNLTTSSGAIDGFVLKPGCTTLVAYSNGAWSQQGSQVPYVQFGANGKNTIPPNVTTIGDLAGHAPLTIPVMTGTGGYPLVIFKEPVIPKVYYFGYTANGKLNYTGAIPANTVLGKGIGPEYILVFIDDNGVPSRLRDYIGFQGENYLCSHSDAGCGY